MTTTATGSPTYRTTPAASSGWPICALIMPAMGGSGTGSPARSAPVNAAITPGASSAALTSTERIRACATAERTKWTWHAPGRRMSSVYTPPVVRKRGSSVRMTLVPSMLTLTILPAPDAGGQSGPMRREERKIG